MSSNNRKTTKKNDNKKNSNNNNNGPAAQYPDDDSPAPSEVHLGDKDTGNQASDWPQQQQHQHQQRAGSDLDTSTLSSLAPPPNLGYTPAMVEDGDLLLAGGGSGEKQPAKPSSNANNDEDDSDDDDDAYNIDNSAFEPGTLPPSIDSTRVQLRGGLANTAPSSQVVLGDDTTNNTSRTNTDAHNISTATTATAPPPPQQPPSPVLSNGEDQHMRSASAGEREGETDGSGSEGGSGASTIATATAAVPRSSLLFAQENDEASIVLFERLRQKKQAEEVSSGTSNTSSPKPSSHADPYGSGQQQQQSSPSSSSPPSRGAGTPTQKSPTSNAATSPSMFDAAVAAAAAASSLATQSSLVPKDAAKKQSQKSVADIKRLIASSNMQQYIAPPGEADAWGRYNKRKTTGKNSAWEHRAWFFPVRLCLFYVIPALKKAKTLGNSLTAKELDPLIPEDSSTGAYLELYKIIHRLKDEDLDDENGGGGNNPLNADDNDDNNGGGGTRSSHKKRSSMQNGKKKNNNYDDSDSDDDDEDEEEEEPRTLGIALLRFVGWGYKGVMWSLLFSACPFGIVALLDYVTDFIDDPQQPTWKGYMYAGLALACQLTQAFAKAQMERTAGHVRARIHGALLMSMMQRCCRPTKPQDMADAADANAMGLAADDEDAFEDDGSGMPPVIQLVTSDCENIAEMIPYLLFNATQMIEIVIAFAYLIAIVGWPAACPIAVFLFLVPFNKSISDKFMDRYEGKATAGDARSSKVEEVMSNIRTIKYYAWEAAMERDITGLRNIEVLCLRSLLGFMVAFSCMCAIATPLMQLSLFAAIYFGPADQGRLDTTVIYQAISLLSIPAWNLSVVPYQVGEWSRLSVSLRRLSRYLYDTPPSSSSSSSASAASINDDGSNTRRSGNKRIVPEMPSMNSKAYAATGNVFDMYEDLEPRKVRQSFLSSRNIDAAGGGRGGGASQRYGEDGLPVYGVKGAISISGAVFVHSLDAVLEDGTDVTADGENDDSGNGGLRIISGRDVNRATLPPNSVSAALGAFALRIDEFVADPGELILVVGKVGSGKSSLLASVLGQMICANSQYASNFVDGKVSIVPQSPWILNGTVRNNIILDNSYNEAKYQLCLAASALAVDLSLFGNGDATVVGAKGATLSGGQRQRLSIARALYRDADIYIFDDSLSALDATVGRQVFDNAICGLLKSKTRIVVTHQLGLLPMADRIYVVDDGNVVQQELPSVITAEPEEDEGPLAALLRAWKESVDVLAGMEGGGDAAAVEGGGGVVTPEASKSPYASAAASAVGSPALVAKISPVGRVPLSSLSHGIEALANHGGGSDDDYSSSDEAMTGMRSRAAAMGGGTSSAMPSFRSGGRGFVPAPVAAVHKHSHHSGAAPSPSSHHGNAAAPNSSYGFVRNNTAAGNGGANHHNHHHGHNHHHHHHSAAPSGGANPFSFRTDTLRNAERAAVTNLIAPAVGSNHKNASNSPFASAQTAASFTVTNRQQRSNSVPGNGGSSSPILLGDAMKKSGGGGGGGGASSYNHANAKSPSASFRTTTIGGKRVTMSFSEHRSMGGGGAAANGNNHATGTSMHQPFFLPPASSGGVGANHENNNSGRNGNPNGASSFSFGSDHGLPKAGGSISPRSKGEGNVIRTADILTAVKVLQESNNDAAIRVVSAACDLARLSEPSEIDASLEARRVGRKANSNFVNAHNADDDDRGFTPEISPRKANGTSPAITPRSALKQSSYNFNANNNTNTLNVNNNNAMTSPSTSSVAFALGSSEAAAGTLRPSDLSAAIQNATAATKKKSVQLSSDVVEVEATQPLVAPSPSAAGGGGGARHSQKRLVEAAAPDPLPPQLDDGSEQFTEASVMGTLGRYLITCGGCVFWTQMTLLHFLTVAFSVAGSWWLGKWAEEDTFGLEEESGSLAVLGIYAGALVVSALIVLVREFAWREGCLRPPTVLFARMTKAILEAPVSFFDVNPLGRILTRFTKDSDQIDYTIPTATNELFVSIAAQVGSLIAICITLPYFTPLAVLVVIGVPLLRPSHSLVVLRRVADASLSPVTEIFSEADSGTASIVILKLTRLFMRRLQRALDDYNAARYMDKIAFEFVRLRVSIMMSCIGCGVIVVMTILRDTMNPATAGFVISQTVNITNFLSYMVEQLGTLTLSLNSVARVNDYCATEPEKGGTEVPPAGWPKVPVVEFKTVRAQYRPDLPIVIKNLNITLTAGEKIGVCGRTGSGKSTLIQCLLRMVPMLEGSHVIIDGLDTEGLNVKHLRRRLTVIPQEPVIFAGTLRYNLDPIGEHKDARLIEVLYACQVHVAMRKMFEGNATNDNTNGGGDGGANSNNNDDTRSVASSTRVDRPAYEDGGEINDERAGLLGAGSAVTSASKKKGRGKKLKGASKLGARRTLNEKESGIETKEDFISPSKRGNLQNGSSSEEDEEGNDADGNAYSDREEEDANENTTNNVPGDGATLMMDCLDIPMSASSLSVGQKQLLCLARAVLRGTNVLILDEATSSVDAVTDQLIQTVIRTVFDGCTVLTIAHRINTIVDSDRILVMDKGVVAEFDTPSELLKNSESIFSALVRQSKEEH